uniref:Ig-like domain-containing protein n=1 Tax=Sus scrofa TaxID=9823 RepID=A0A8D1M916_PIG
MSVLEAFTFLSFWALGLSLSRVEQSQVSVSAEVKKSVDINCKIESTNFPTEAVHWYRQRTNQALEHLVYVTSITVPAQNQIGGKSNKVVARKNSQTFTSTLTVNFIEKEDAGIYYCAGWNSSRWIKIFGEGTKLIVTPPDRNLAADMSPKPTIFLPSIAEINLHNTGTHLCLLEKFFPDAIKVYWKEKNGNTVLDSQQGDVIQTNDTYMKFSWLTVTQKSADKEHICIVKHENNKRGTDQEILFPSMNKEVTTDVCLKDTSGTMQLQLTNTSAYYTYLLLLLKSALYFAIITYCLFRETTVCSAWKRS